MLSAPRSTKEEKNYAPTEKERRVIRRLVGLEFAQQPLVGCQADHESVLVRQVELRLECPAVQFERLGELERFDSQALHVVAVGLGAVVGRQRQACGVVVGRQRQACGVVVGRQRQACGVVGCLAGAQRGQFRQ